MTGRWHGLAEHVRSTARLARIFAASFGAGELAWSLGLVHDAGKCASNWQDKLMRVAPTGARVGIDHKRVGVLLVRERALAAAMTVLGHHGGLGQVRSLIGLESQPEDTVTLQRFFAEVPEARALATGSELMPAAWSESPLLGEMGIRMTFSALVDADHLDTAAHAQGLDRPRVAASADMGDLLRRFEANRVLLLDRRGGPGGSSEVDAVRTALYEDVVRLALGEPGIYRLPAPTGSGKTLTSAGFALHHAA
ncbi:CRISPR-associated endonuclease Cas3'' [Saccharothrix longispora]|uniref:CRISPR-associated endonuclease Cas3-HD n=1 Tax=Saccharothrix longispora TaxID=33920 RepID=A0ABU1PP80_9PSEU|nr:CRISPR-associated endonuclease Cas3'' [Saccharothrix longispora]MDR6592477.1 CRISPR-associated endonuclease Cas3-HD [Saccharothrix longispora]